jgi:hypothetical protein
MAKGGANPAEAHRKAQKAKDKKRNKEAREKAKQDQAVKAGAGRLGGEISTLAEKGSFLTHYRGPTSLRCSRKKRLAASPRTRRSNSPSSGASLNGFERLEQSKLSRSNPKLRLLQRKLTSRSGIPKMASSRTLDGASTMTPSLILVSPWLWSETFELKLPIQSWSATSWDAISRTL